MKRFLVFGGDCYYPGGGWDDFLSTHDTLEEARAATKNCNQDWWHVVDIQTMQIVPTPDFVE